MLIGFQPVTGHATDGAQKLQAPGSRTPEPTARSDLYEQVIGIIVDILSSPVRPQVREKLLRHVANNPGHPERALFDHLRDPDLRRPGHHER
ncbi:hypothetical protein [Arthrobacter sp. NPDC056493]|uniref:hypothetical protein n=1 Tax=Arthrobacter sp. NPDC056493 TaxID=3345839 RepID=UPI00366F2D3F